MINPHRGNGPSRSAESIAALAYFGVYLTYLFINPEGELLHWLTLVLLPLALLLVIRPARERHVGVILESIGLERQTWKRWLGWSILIGFSLGMIQLVLSRSADKILDIILSGQVVYKFPLAFVLLLLTAGTTEETFFRGILLTRIEFLVRSRVAAVLVSSLLFGIYHLPYAYLNPRWPSAGDWEASFAAALGQGIPGGLILGTVYYVSGRNLLAPIIVHTLINTLPAMALIRFGGA